MIRNIKNKSWNAETEVKLNHKFHIMDKFKKEETNF